MSQIRSRIEYLIPADTIVAIILHSNMIKTSLIEGFSMQFNDSSEVAFFLDHPVHEHIRTKWIRHNMWVLSSIVSRYLGYNNNDPPIIII